MATLNRRELAGFLRSRRARVRPRDVGLEAGTRRRTPGLRREEVARLAGISVDYYIRMEQARGPRPSRQVLGALARALRLTDDERAHLHHLAGESPEPPKGPPRDVPRSVLHLLDQMDDTPALVLDAKYDVLAWNDLAAARYPGDAGIAELVAEVRAIPELAALWAEHEVRRRRATTKRIDHPVVGPLELHCEVLLVPDRDQRIMLYTAAPGSPDHEALRLLKVVGTQRLTGDPHGPEHEVDVGQ